jgi:hypothetical protein
LHITLHFITLLHIILAGSLEAIIIST